MAEITDFGPRKTFFILAIVFGCFTVLWPKILQPMFIGFVTPHHSASDGSDTIPQERRTPPHAGGMHPALRERGRAIPTSHIVPKIMDRSDHVIPKMRPPLGGAGHVVPAPKGNGTMGIIMPLYTIGIVLFFVYTIVKVLKKNSDSEIISEYPGAAAEKEFRKMVFSPEALATAMTGGTLHCRERSPHMTAPTIEELNDQAAGDIEIDQLRQRLVETEAAMERIVVQMGNISRSHSVMHNSSSQPEIKEDTADQESHSREGEEELDVVAEQSPTVKVMGMEMTASCESGQKCSRPTTPIIPTPSNVEREKTPPTPIYLEGALPPQCELLVTDSETQAEKSDDDDAPVVLSGKMTLSVISLDQIPADSEAEDPDKKRKKLDTQMEIRDVKGNREVEEEENEVEEEEIEGVEEDIEEIEEDENEEVEEGKEEKKEEEDEDEEEEEEEEGKQKEEMEFYHEEEEDYVDEDEENEEEEEEAEEEEAEDEEEDESNDEEKEEKMNMNSMKKMTKK